jgi:hypothetical protein
MPRNGRPRDHAFVGRPSPARGHSVEPLSEALTWQTVPIFKLLRRGTARLRISQVFWTGFGVAIGVVFALLM